jgi:DNA invertase Pin-like site-specific DNA recombinase
MIARIRCAIYTRKSSEEGLDQAFNSLHAQREACEAYVKSQQHEGWQIIPTHYDDGGFSGGNIERPAFKQLMADISAGKVSIVVVYKVDRLTRSLADFAKIIDQFEKHKVSFVSITQQFNTTNSMGRLTLNVLLSFAQFEREVTSERIRDKIAASKRKGMWMGGTVPLGYLCHERKLIVNETEASTVCTIFNEYLRLKNVQSLRDWLIAKNIKSRSGGYFFHGPLYLMLRNPIYVGLIKHKKETFPGEHPGIVSREIWDRVQMQLNENIRGGGRKARVTKESLFLGTLFDSSGTQYTPTHAKKCGRRYRYYTSRAVIRKTKKCDGPGRIPAPDIEKEVVDRILGWLQAPSELIGALQEDLIESLPEGFTSQLIAGASDIARNWRSRVAPDRRQFVKSIIERVIIHSDHLEIRLSLPALLHETFGAGSIPITLPQSISIECPFHHVNQGRVLRLIIANTSITTDASRRAIVKAIARARTWYEQITSGEIRSIAELGAKHNVSARFIRIHMSLVQLSPESIERLMNRPEALPPSLNDLLREIPMNWTAQKFGQTNRVQGSGLSAIS